MDEVVITDEKENEPKNRRSLLKRKLTSPETQKSKKPKQGEITNFFQKKK